MSGSRRKGFRSALVALFLLLFVAAGGLVSSQEPGAQGAREQRPRALLPIDGVGPIAPAQWKVLRPREGDTVALKEPVDSFLVEDAIVQASPRTAIICYEHRGPFRNVTVRNSILRVEPRTIPLDRSYWGVRGYDMANTLFERVEITGFGAITWRHDEGHAMYLNVSDSLTIVDCDIHHNGGQGLQLVNRPNESVFGSRAALGSVQIRHTRFHENGFNPDRGGFQVSIFGTGQAIRMEDVEIVAGYDATPYPTGFTGGGLLIEAEGYNPARPERRVWWRPAELPDDWVEPFAQGATELVGVRIQHRRPDKPLMQVKGCETLVVTDGLFSGGRVELDRLDKPGRDCGYVQWKRNRGDAQVYYKGELVGRADQDFERGTLPEEREEGEDERGRSAAGGSEGG
jgi:hypothetical protein